jgi:hypothetical protein
MNIVKKIYADGRTEEVNRKMTLEEMQAFVGGYIEVCPSNITRRCLVINEEGLLIDLPVNHEATKLVNPATLTCGGLRGNVLLAKGR